MKFGYEVLCSVWTRMAYLWLAACACSRGNICASSVSWFVSWLQGSIQWINKDNLQMLTFQAGQIVVAKRGGYYLEICPPTFVSPVILSFSFCIMLFVLRKICRLVSLGELTQALVRVCCNWSSQRLHFRLTRARPTAQAGLLIPAAYPTVGE